MKHPASHKTSGFAVLPMTLILLSSAALMLLFTQRNLLTDMRIAQNGYRNRLAYVAADSGLANVLYRLNDPAQRTMLLSDSKGTGTYDVIASPTVNVPLGDVQEARVKLQGLALGVPALRLRLYSTGCIKGCERGSVLVSQTVTLRGGILQLPYALLTARGNISASGPVSLSNQNAAARGLLMHAGAAISHDALVQRTSLPGINPDLADIANDKNLARLSANDFFLQWFGADKAFVQSHAAHLSCQGDCASAIAAAGARVIWLDGSARLSSGNFGSTAAPVILIASGPLEISGPARIIGIIYSQAATTQVHLSQGSIEGALIAENALEVSQGGQLSYNPIILQRAQSTLGHFMVVPGSWSDGE